MKTKFRILALLLAIVTVLCFAGCKKKGTDGESGGESYSASSGLEMTETQAESLENSMSVKLYFPTANKKGLVSETVLVEYTSKNKKTSNLVNAIVTQMLKGPKDKANASSLFPEGTELESVKIKDHCAKISFNRAFGKNLPKDADEMKMLVMSIVNTVTEVKDVDSVMIFCSGDDMGKLENGFDMNAKFTRDMSLVVGASAESSSDNVVDPYAEELYLDVPLE